jgi:hypothetical protein
MSNKNEFIKKPNTEAEYSAFTIQELKKCKSDPVYFISNYMFVQHPKLGKIPLRLHDYQIRCIRAFQQNRWCVVKAGRQLGKSTVIAAYLLWFACFHFDKYILVASNKNAGAIDIMNRIRFAYEELPDWLKPGAKAFNKHSVEFDNDSMITSSATTENTGRGRSISLLMLDELAFVQNRIQDEMWTSLAPTISTGGSCIISSTPNGDMDLFAKIWREAEAGMNGFVPVEVLWNEHPERTEEFKRDMISKVGEEKWLQEYECQFISSDDLLINSITLANLRSKAPLKRDKGFIFWKEPSAKMTYIIGVDVAQGMKKDYASIEVVELETMEQIAEFRSNSVKEPELYQAIKWIIEKLLTYRDRQGNPPAIHWSFENNAVGAAIAALFNNDEHFPHDAELVSNGDKIGINTSGKSKAMACKTLKTLIEKPKNNLVINSDPLIRELKTYVRSGSAYAAKWGMHDDLISGMLIVAQIIKQLSEYEPEVFNTLYESEGEFYQETEENSRKQDDEYGSVVTEDEGDDPIPFVF